MGLRKGAILHSYNFHGKLKSSPKCRFIFLVDWTKNENKFPLLWNPLVTQAQKWSLFLSLWVYACVFSIILSVYAYLYNSYNTWVVSIYSPQVDQSSGESKKGLKPLLQANPWGRVMVGMSHVVTVTWLTGSAVHMPSLAWMTLPKETSTPRSVRGSVF